MKQIIILLCFFSIWTCSLFCTLNEKSPYYLKPIQGLESALSFPVPDFTQTIVYAYKPIITDEEIYYPVNTSYKIGSDKFSYSTIYAIDPVTFLVKDSLQLKNKGNSYNFKYVVQNKDTFVIGLIDHKCYIYQTDKNLKINKEFDTGIEVNAIFYAGSYHSNIRLIMQDIKSSVYLYDFDSDLKLERQILLHDKVYQYTTNNDRLWFSDMQDSTITITGFNLSEPEPKPLQYTDTINIPLDSMKLRTYIFKMSGNTAYFAYTRFTKEGPMSHLISINIKDKTKYDRVIEGTFSFDLLERNGITYLYGTQKLIDSESAVIKVLGTDLKDKDLKLVVSYSEYTSPQYILPLKDDMVIITGNYMVQTGTRSPLDTGSAGTVMVPDTKFIPFIATYKLK